MSAAIDEIHAALTDMTSQVCLLAAKLRPAVFPSYLQLNSIFDLCVSKSQRESAQKWLSSKGDDDSQTGFVTVIDYPRRHVKITQLKVVDSSEARLYSVDTVMQSMVLGSQDEFNAAVLKFLHINGFDTSDVSSHQHIFNEVYNMSYAMKVLISNVGGFTASVGEYSLPLSAGEDIVRVLDSVFCEDTKEEEFEEENGMDVIVKKNMKQKKRAKVNDDSSDDDDDDEEEEEEVQVQVSTKKRKHKRGGKKM